MKLRPVFVTLTVMGGLLALGIGAAPRYIEELAIGGGYGNPGAWLLGNGDIVTDGDVMVDGTLAVGGVATFHNRVEQTGLGDSTFFGDSAGADDDGNNRRNTGFGSGALAAVTTGQENVALGQNALLDLTGANQNLGMGTNAGRRITTGSANTAIGHAALAFVTTGADNMALGHSALQNLSTQSGNTAIGYRAARYHGAAGTENNTGSALGVFIGRDSRPLNATGANEIVLGQNAVGAGSNSVVIGNTNIATTKLRGNVTVEAGGADGNLSAMNDIAAGRNLSAAGGALTAGIQGATRGVLTVWDGPDEEAPGAVKMASPSGSVRYLFIDDSGRLRIHTALPTSNTDGEVVGLQF